MNSESITNLLLAISTVQEAVPKIAKKADGYNYKYATLDDIWEAIREPMKEAGLHWLAMPTAVGLWYRLEWISTAEENTDGSLNEYVEGIAPLPNDPNPQKVGSAITYMRRYALVSVLNLMLGEDDDGAKAAEPPSVESQFNQKCCKCERTDTRTIKIEGTLWHVCPEHVPSE